LLLGWVGFDVMAMFVDLAAWTAEKFYMDAPSKATAGYMPESRGANLPRFSKRLL
jgi:hypothetical protein